LYTFDHDPHLSLVSILEQSVDDASSSAHGHAKVVKVRVEPGAGTKEYEQRQMAPTEHDYFVLNEDVCLLIGPRMHLRKRR
jgi:hypothetical protein